MQWGVHACFFHYMIQRIPDHVIEKFIESSVQSFELAENDIHSIIQSGYSITQFLVQTQELYLSGKLSFHAGSTNAFILNNSQCALLATKLGSVFKCLLDGADGQLQLLDLSAYIYQLQQTKIGSAISIYT